ARTELETGAGPIELGDGTAAALGCGAKVCDLRTEGRVERRGGPLPRAVARAVRLRDRDRCRVPAALGGATSTCPTSTSGRTEVSMPERTASVFVQRTIACSTSASSSSAATPKPSWNSSMNWDALYSFLARPSRQRYAVTICLLRP